MNFGRKRRLKTVEELEMDLIQSEIEFFKSIFDELTYSIDTFKSKEEIINYRQNLFKIAPSCSVQYVKDKWSKEQQYLILDYIILMAHKININMYVDHVAERLKYCIKNNEVNIDFISQITDLLWMRDLDKVKFRNFIILLDIYIDNLK